MANPVNQSEEVNPPQVNATPVVVKRPANGFLAFCHRHRKIVSRRNVRLENRMVTKILGSWWSSLKKEQRKVYEDKANEYKRLFLAANPGYKWYNQKPSTGNSPVTRQSNRRGRKLENNGCTVGGAITPGKLADESQMGGLNSLMLPTAEPPKKRHQDMVNYIANEHDYLETKPDNINNNSIISDGNPSQECIQAGCGMRHQSEIHKTEIMATEVLFDQNENDVTMENASAHWDVAEMDDKKAVKEENVGEESAMAVEKLENSEAPKYEFCDFVKCCPIYSYDAYMAQKAEKNPSSKRSLAKQRKWQLALTEYTPDEATDSNGGPRRRKRRGGNYRPQKRMNRTILENDDSLPHTQTIADDDSVPHTITVADDNQNFNPFSNIDLLVSAAESLEKGRVIHCA